MKRETAVLLLLLLLAFGLRVWGLADHNIWWDEGVGAWAARLPAPEIVRWTAHDVHPPLYYLLLRGWWLLVGGGEFVLRFPSVVVSTLGVVAVYGFGRDLGEKKAGLMAALLFTLSRFVITWAQEIRMYALATTLSVGALWAAVRLWRGDGWRIWAAYILTMAAALLSIYLTASVWLIVNLAFVVAWLRLRRPRRLLLRWVTAQLGVVILFVPWMAYALPRMLTPSTSESLSPLFFLHLYATTLVVGVPIDVETYTAVTLAVFGVAALGTLALWRARRSAQQTAGLTLLLLGLTLPALMTLAFSIPGNPYFARPLAPRYFLPLSICFYPLLAWGLAALTRRRRWVGALGTGLAVAVALSGLASFYPGRARRDDYVSLAATLRAHRHPGDEVVLHTDKDWPIFAAHYAGGWHGVPSGRSMDGAAADAFLSPIWPDSEGVWLVTTPDAQRMDPQDHLETWLGARTAISRTWPFGENALAFYARTPERAAAVNDLGPEFQPPEGPRAEFASGARLAGAQVPLPRCLKGDTLHLFLFWSRPPEEKVAVEMVGAASREQLFEPPDPARRGPTRQQIDLSLAPDLPAGRYRLLVRPGGGEGVEVGQFTLVRRGVSGWTSPRDIAHPLNVRLGESIALVGYDLETSAVEPGGRLELTLYWKALEPVKERYKVFTHLIGETYNADTDNFIWAQQDNEPVNWQAPTTLWTPGVVVADPYQILLADDAPTGRYTLEVGMYGLVDGSRLPVFGPDGEPLGDALLLTEVEVRDG